MYKIGNKKYHLVNSVQICSKQFTKYILHKKIKEIMTYRIHDITATFFITLTIQAVQM